MNILDKSLQKYFKGVKFGDYRKILEQLQQVNSSKYLLIPGNKFEEKLEYLSTLFPKPYLKICTLKKNNNCNFITYLKEYFEVEIIIFNRNERKKDSSIDFVLFIEDEEIDMFPKDFEGDKYSENLSMYLQYEYFKKIGIGNGANLLAHFKGCPILEDVENHNKSHEITTFDGRSFLTPSNHTKLMYPYSFHRQFRILAHSSYFLSEHYSLKKDKNYKVESNELEVEIMMINDNCLCIQGDPSDKDETISIHYGDYCQNLITDFTENKLTINNK